MALRIALSGFVVLVVAMGIGRFAFTPQVPLMIAAGQLTLTSAGLVAAMNYLGYLVGAWDAMRAHRFVETRLWLGIFGAVALTLLSAAADNAVVHGLLRFVIGCMSGWSMVLVLRSAGCLPSISRLRRFPPVQHGKSTAYWRWCLSRWWPGICRVRVNFTGRAAHRNRSS